MWLNELRRRWLGRPRSIRRRRLPTRRNHVRLTLEHLENRLVPATFNAVDVPSLIADINTANGNGLTNTINLTASSGIYTLTVANNSTDGPTGLPVITSPHLLTINGNFATIERSFATGTPAFRLFDVASGAALMLKNVTLEDGLAKGAGVSADGGGIYNKGTLTLNGATVLFNEALGSNGALNSPNGQDAAGGGIWSSGGSLSLTGSTLIEFNFANGGAGAAAGNGGNAFGAGVYANLTKVSITAGGILQDCFARGGTGGNGSNSGSASGGGLYATGSATALEPVSLTSVLVQYNIASGGGTLVPGGVGSNGGSGSGGGLFVNDGMLTLSGDHIQNNSAEGGNGGNGANVIGGTGGAGGNGGDAKGGGLYISGGSLSESSFLLVQNNNAQDPFGFSGNGGNGGNGKHGGKGGNGGNAFGGGIYTTGAAVKVTGSPVFQHNEALGISGGRGGSATASGTAGGNGGNGGSASGGALYAAASGTLSVSLQNATVQNNVAFAAFGGFGGKGHAGVNGGSSGNQSNAEGGALFLAQNATLANDFIQANKAEAGTFAFGGSGVSGGHGGVGGRGAGGGLFVDGGTITITSSTIDSNAAQGGSGGSVFNDPTTPGLAGAGGTGTGGGIAIDLGTLTVKSSHLDSNIARGGNGGADYNSAFQVTGTAAFQGAGGAGYGGGLYVGGGTVHLTLDDLESNQADAGNSGGGVRSTAASGGGLYTFSGVVTKDVYTTQHIINNTDSNNDSHNNIGP